MFKYLVSAIVAIHNLYGAITLTNISQLSSVNAPGTNTLLYLVKVTTNAGNLVYTPYKLTPSLTNIESLVGGPLRYVITAGTNIVIGTNGNVITVNTPAVNFSTSTGITNLANVLQLVFSAGTNVVLTTNGNSIVVNSTLSGGGASLPGTMINNGTAGVGWIAVHTNASGTQLVASASLYLTNGTNVNILGGIAADNLNATNGITAGSFTGSGNITNSGIYLPNDAGTFYFGLQAYDTAASNNVIVGPASGITSGIPYYIVNTVSGTNYLYLTNLAIGNNLFLVGGTLTGATNSGGGGGTNDNWTALGTTNSTLTGNAFANSLQLTNTLTLLHVGAPATWIWYDQVSGDTIGYRLTPMATMTTNINEIPPPAPLADGSLLMWKNRGSATNEYLTNAVAGVDYSLNVNWSAVGTTNSSLAGNLTANGGVFTNTLTLNGVAVSTNSSGGAIANTVLGSGTTAANDIAVFTDTTHTNIARSTSTGRMGDNSSSTYTLTIDLSGTDAVFTFGSALATFSGTWDINQGTSDAAIFKGRGGTVSGSGTTVLYDFTGTENTSANATFFRIYATNTTWGASGLLLDVGINTSTSEFNISRSGAVVAAGAISSQAGAVGAGSIQSVGLVCTSRGRLAASADGVWNFTDNAATGFTSLTLGPADASPNNAELKTPDGSGTDIGGGTLSIEGGKSTGTGRGGDLIIKTTPSSTTGSSANSYSERAHYSAKTVTLTESSATLFANISIASSKFVGANLTCTINANDGTDFQSLTSTVRVDAVNKAGTVTATLTQTDNTTAASSGTLTCTYTAVANGAGVDIKANAVSSLTQTVLNCTWAIVGLNSDGVATVTAQ